jgi:hypothetical protein
MQAPLPDSPFFCPVCERSIVLIWLWQDPDSSRIRLFCEDCSHLDEYRPLPKEQRTILSLEGFQRFAARRLLTHVAERERAKRAGEAAEHEKGR